MFLSRMAERSVVGLSKRVLRLRCDQSSPMITSPIENDDHEYCMARSRPSNFGPPDSGATST